MSKNHYWVVPALYMLVLYSTVFALCPDGDFNGNCEVELTDLAYFCEYWLDYTGTSADLDDSSLVDFLDFAIFSKNWHKSVGPVMINEFMASNSTIPDTGSPGEYPDWIELYNLSSFPVDLGGMYLTDDLSNQTMWQIPSGVTIAPSQYMVFWADEKNVGPNHTNFKLRADGDQIGLYDLIKDAFMDSIDFSELQQQTDVSFGRYEDGTDNLRYFSTPTPGSTNSGAYLDAVADTKFSHNRGFYDTAFDLIITCDTPDATIKYTTDGTKPTLVNGSTFNPASPIHINATSTVRAAAFKGSWLSTNVDTHTYIFGASAVKKAIPTLSMVGISGSRGGTGTPISLELIYPAELLAAKQSNWQGFQSDCETADHSVYGYRLEWKTENGESNLNYPFFEAAPLLADRTTDRFDRIVLRVGKNTPTTYLGDPWVQVSEKEITGFGCNSMFMHLYQNGVYVGIVNPKERPDAWSWSSYYGGNFDDYFVLNMNFEPNRGNKILSGNRSRFDYMMNNITGLSNYSNYQTFKAYCDVTHFADYTILFWYSGFGDGLNNNYYGGMRNNPLNGKVPPEGFTMMMWDGEHCFTGGGGPAGSLVPWVHPQYGTKGAVIPVIWNKLKASPEFMILFYDRIYKHIYNGGALTDENSWGRWSTLAAYVTAAGQSPGLVTNNMQGFANTFITAVRAAGYYPAINPPSFQHGGIVSPGYQLSMSGSGTIYYTLNGTDPRVVGGAAAGTVYSGPITLNQSTRVKARAKTTVWSALHEAVFGVGPVKENLRITELMYHPADPTAAEIAAGFTNDEEFEYVELTNISTTESINLALVSFNNGIDYTFPSYSLAAGEYIVVAKNPAAFAMRYLSVPSGKVLGPYTGTSLFDNDGERVVLQDAIGQTIHDFEYNDTWYPLTDGAGFSLTILNPAHVNLPLWDQKIGWRASTLTGGSPGQSEAGLAPGSIVINELLAHSHDTTPDWIELYNTTTQSISISGWFLSDDPGNLTKYTIADNTEIPAGGFMVFYQDQHFGSAFALSENGETIFLTSGAGGQITGYQAVQQFDASARDVTLGRYLKSDGDMDFVAMSSPTPSTANAYPGVGPIVISEIQYNPAPANTGDEYIELRNISGQTVVLQDLVNTETAPGVFVEETISWSFTDGIDFIFPANTQIADGKSLIVAKNPTAFIAYYTGLPLGIQVLGPFANGTSLGNGGEKVRLCRPGEQPLGQPRSWIRADQVTYDDESPWPTTPDGGGKTLQRIMPSQYGNDPANWTALNPAPGQ